jgi:hypothetical protein
MDTLVFRPFAELSIRVHPPAALVFLNGKKVNNPLQKKKLVEGHYLLKAQYLIDNKPMIKEWSVNLKPGQKLKQFYDLFQEKHLDH